MTKVGLATALFVVTSVACGDRGTGVARVESAPAGAIARVGGAYVSAATVARIAKAQGLTAREACGRAISDAIFAEAARRGPVTEATREYAARTARARALLAGLARAAEDAGPPTEAELGPLVSARWWEFDRPELRRSVHAVVAVGSDADSAGEERALAVARRIHDAVRGLASAQEFIKTARAIPAEGLKVRAETLLPAARDGRAVDLEQPPLSLEQSTRYATEFTEALFDLDKGEVSAPFRTPFGYHVVLVSEVIAPRSLSRAELVRELGVEVRDRRAGRAKDELLGRLRAKSPPTVERAALDLTKKLVEGS